MSIRKKIPFIEALQMIFDYAKSRIIDQIKSVAFIIIYLVAFQLFILGSPLLNALSIAFGIALVVFGLAFFLEGLILGLMPLGERVGIKLPTKVGIVVISVFGLILGFGATLAEPAISALKTAGSSITAWDSPLLYLILNRYTQLLILSVGIGVGFAVALGMFRFYFNWSIKPIIYTIIPLVLILSVYASFDVNLSKLIGLAWDCGAVTTGAVTVPLVLALGIGVSRSSSKGKGSSGGFGIILLASAFPILSVLMLGIILNFNAPKPMNEFDFFSQKNRVKNSLVFENEQKLFQHAFSHGTEAGRIALFGDEKVYFEELSIMKNNTEKQKRYLGNSTLNNWLEKNASTKERALFAEIVPIRNQRPEIRMSKIFQEETIGGLRAVIPLSLLLLLVLVLMLKEKIRYKDEVALGIGFTLIGMIMLTTGIRLGLASLGSEVGAQLPKAFAQEPTLVEKVVIKNFDTSLVYSAIDINGDKKQYFNYQDEEQVTRVKFEPEHYHHEKKQYLYNVTEPPLFSSKLTILGIILVLIFAFGMGYGATMAEPALNALGITVEGLSAGAMKRAKIVKVVSIGVGLGIVLGFVRILYDLPLIWLIVPPYLLLIPLTILSDEEFTAIAWDSGGVTTGPVTVPLVLAMGLSIGSALNIVDGFGVLALASAFPIITTLIYGLISRTKQRKSLKDNINESDNG